MSVARNSLLASLIVMTMLAGCGGDKGPTAAEAAQTLKTDVTNLLDIVNGRNVRVADDGTRDMPCGKGKARRAYRASAAKQVVGWDDPNGLVNEMVGALTGKYKVVKTDVGPRVSPRVDLRDAKAHTNLTVRSPQQGRIEIEGTTDCLRNH